MGLPNTVHIINKFLQTNRYSFRFINPFDPTFKKALLFYMHMKYKYYVIYL